MYSKFKDGSNWIKCDFHVHTPCSILNNQFGDNFDEYVKELFTKALNKNISVIGITDYFSIDGYKKIKSEYLKKETLTRLGFSLEEIEKILEILIIPNIEFRIKINVGKSKINYHVIFSDKLTADEIEKNFLHQLKFSYAYNDKRALIKENIEDFGTKLKSEQKSFMGKNSLRVGMEQLDINEQEIREILSTNQKFKNKYIIAIPPDEDLNKLSWDGQTHNIRKILIQQADCLFSSNPNTIKWATAEKDNLENFINEFKSLKPCIHGSDAHNFENLFEPKENRYCWIKAIPTFEGIRQILFEPKERVYIGESLPYNKPPYNIIERVKFIDPQKNFSDEWIYLNQNLNSIIGGKSSGKSILLYYIAKTIIPEKIDKLKMEIGENISYLEYEFEKDNKDFDFIVQWKDGTINKLSDKNSERKITYIPQLYINHIAENRNRKSELNQIIFDILKEKVEFKNKNLEIEKKIEDIKFEIHKNINTIFSKRERLKQLEEEKKEIGDLEGIKTNILLLNEKIEKNQKESSLKDEERLEYQKIQDKIELNKKLQKEYENDNKIFEEYILEVQTKINQDQEEYNKILEKNIDLIIDGDIKEKIINYNNELQKILKSLDSKLNEIKNEKLDINSLIDKNLKLEEDLNPYLKKLKSIDEHKKLLDLVTTEKNKIQQLELKNKEISKIEQELKNIDLKENYQNLMGFYNEKIENHEIYTNISDNLQLKVELKFNSENFKMNFSEKISKKSSLDRQFENLGFENNDYIFKESTEHLKNILSIYNKIMEDEKIKLNIGATKKNVIEALFDDYFTLDYDLIQNGDTLLKMSPGKKGIILFQLFLQLSNADTPILIDQPEDNLDNRTVYSELNNFIKDRKNKRQVIMVSHNANLVVSTDSENIIVANQEINDIKEYNDKYRFEYVSGPLEKTFILDNIEKLNNIGIREHVCEILEGGETAFKLREAKYNL